MEYEPATVGDATGEWDPLGAVQARLAALKRDLAQEQDPVARTALEGRIAELTFAVANPGDRRVLVRNFVERFGFNMVGDATATGHRRGRHERALADRLLARRVGSRPAVPLHERGAERSVCRCWPVSIRIARSGRRIRCPSWTPSRSTSSG